MRLFYAKLSALGYPGSETYDATDELAFRHLVAWLEDHRICHYKPEARQALRNFGGDTDMEAWSAAFNTYLADIHCPLLNHPELLAGDRAALTDWLLGRAVSLHFADKTVGGAGAEQQQLAKTAAAAASQNPLDSLDFKSEEFRKGVLELAALLKVPPHPDHQEMLKACCLLIVERLNPEVLKRARDDAGRLRVERIPFEDVPIGFETPDSRSAELARILRLLYVADLRALQTKINHAIVQVQAITADPKTDERLGKVGRG